MALEELLEEVAWAFVLFQPYIDEVLRDDEDSLLLDGAQGIE